jgi:hypothetical protein
MNFKQVIINAFSIYGITESGQLLWYQDAKRDGTNDPNGGSGWAPRSGSPIGTGWEEFSYIFAGSDPGVIYAVKPTGELLWYRDLAQNGTNGPQGGSGWDHRSGSQIGKGWNVASHVFSGLNGVIYLIKPTGELFWYRDLKRDGTNNTNTGGGWDPHSGKQIGIGWNNFSQVFSSPFPSTTNASCIIYGVKPTGELIWNKDLKGDGSNAPNGNSGWDPHSGSQIGNGWQIFTDVFSPGGGLIYAIKKSGELLWYEDQMHNGTEGWAIRSGSQIGIEWFLVPAALPTELQFDNDSITFSDGVAVGGYAHLTLRQDGTYSFSGHFHDSGAAEYNVNFAVVVKDSAGKGYAFQQSGHVAGTLESGSRDFDWDESDKKEVISQNWANLATYAVMNGQASVSLDPIALMNTVVGALGLVIGVVSIIVA